MCIHCLDYNVEIWMLTNSLQILDMVFAYRLNGKRRNCPSQKLHSQSFFMCAKRFFQNVTEKSGLNLSMTDVSSIVTQT